MLRVTVLYCVLADKYPLNAVSYYPSILGMQLIRADPFVVDDNGTRATGTKTPSEINIIDM